MDLLNKIEQWSGPLRAKTFLAAAEFILRTKPKLIIETGCYRGGDSDGHSTLIFAALAKEVGGFARSFDNNLKHVEMAVDLLAEHSLQAFMHVILTDSVTALSLTSDNIGFLYVDSLDYGPQDPGPSQRHELAEIGAAWGKLAPSCGILLDDWDLPQGGKCGLGVPFLTERGWKRVCEGYQILFLRE